MRTEWIRALTASVALATVACTPRPDTEVTVGRYANAFDLWDEDGDGGLSSAEFLPQWTVSFTEWDGDRSGGVSDREFAERVGMNASRFGAFGEWDENDDGQLTAAEFQGGSFRLFDQDRDGTISREEWRRTIGYWEP